MSVGGWIEAAAAGLGLRLLGALPAATASRVAGGIAASVGPWLPVSRVAHGNLRLCLPDLDGKARARVVRGVWRSLGQTVGEFPHLAALHETAHGPGFEIEGREVLDEIFARGGPVIFFSAHMGNWEVFAPAARAYGIAVPAFYRAAANPRVDALINAVRARAAGAGVANFAKGAAGARRAAAHLARGGAMAMLVDQKLNDGIEARFFGRPAMTAPALAVFARRYRCQVVPARIDRLAPARYRLVIAPPLPLPDTGDPKADILALTQAVNDVVEQWIRARPESWLWLHRRWPKEAVLF
jgi:KDO2-lipid IV(A) lauroyltransferase